MISINLLEDKDELSWFCEQNDRVFHCKELCDSPDVCNLSLYIKYKYHRDKGCEKKDAYEKAVTSSGYKDTAREIFINVISQKIEERRKENGQEPSKNG